MILDTNAISDWAESNEKLRAILPEPSRLWLPVIALGEYLSGVYRSNRRDRLEAWLRQVIHGVRLAEVDASTAETYAQIKARLLELGRPIPTNDVWIAALAIQHGLPVLSRDTDFDAIDGVTRIGW